MKISYHCVEQDDDVLHVWDDGVTTYLEVATADPASLGHVALDRTGLIALTAHLGAIRDRVLDTPPIRI